MSLSYQLVSFLLRLTRLGGFLLSDFPASLSLTAWSFTFSILLTSFLALSSLLASVHLIYTFCEVTGYFPRQEGYLRNHSLGKALDILVDSA